MKTLNCLLIILLLSSCGDIALPSDELESVFGDWETYRVFNPWGFDSLYTVDNTIDVTITADGHYMTFENGEKITDNRFHFTHVDQWSGIESYMLDFNDHKAQDLFIYYLSPDTIALTPYGWNDADVDYYVRVN